MDDSVRKQILPMTSISITSFLCVSLFFAVLLFIPTQERRIGLLVKWLLRQFTPQDIHNLLPRRRRHRNNAISADFG